MEFSSVKSCDFLIRLYLVPHDSVVRFRFFPYNETEVFPFFTSSFLTSSIIFTRTDTDTDTDSDTDTLTDTHTV
jgi:hypothetical protein